MVVIYKGEIPMPQQRILKLDKADKTILQILLENARTPLSSIAKIVHLSKPSVLNRIENMKKEKTILGFVPVTNPFSWGYSMYLVLLRTDIAHQEQDFATLKNSPNLWVLFYTQGQYNAIAFFIAKDHTSFSKNWQETAQHLHIKDWKISEFQSYNFIPYHLLVTAPQLKEEHERVLKIQALTHTEAEILYALQTDARASYIALSKKTNISPERIKRTLQDLYHRRVIHRYFTLFDFYSLEWRPFIIRFKTPFTSSKLRNYLLNNKHTNGVYTLSDEWSLLIVAQFKDLYEQRLFLEETLSIFPEIQDYELSILLEQLAYYPLPDATYKELTHKIN